MKRLTITLLAFFLGITLFAQDDDWSKRVRESQESARKEYEQFRQQATTDYNDFRRKANEEYAKFMEEAWTYFKSNPKEEFSWSPKPSKPIVAESNPIPENTLVEINLKPIAPKPIERPNPVEPIPSLPKPKEPVTYIHFFGTEIPFYIQNYRPTRMNDASEKNVAKLWMELSDQEYDNLIAECLRNRTEFNLCDWGYIMLTEQVAELLCGGHTNEAVVLHMYLLTQSGYQMRIGRADGKLFVLVGSSEKIYHYSYFKIKGVNYYLFDKSMEDKPFRIFDHAFPKEKLMSLMTYQPKLHIEASAPRRIVSERFPSVKAMVKVNKNLIDFFNSYPLSDRWTYYSMTSISDMAKDSLYPVLRNAIKGKRESEAANILINFVQTGFSYATDQEQFGYERPMFPDESLYYPFNDCEDRAIFYSCLVRELMGLDVVLLDYPDHLATAVHFTEKVAGFYILFEGERYVICDPTYIGADIGMCMPKYKDVSPSVERF